MEITGELFYNIEGSLDDWVPGPGEWKQSIVGWQPADRNQEGLRDYYEGQVTFRVGIEPITDTAAADEGEPTNWLSPKRKMRFVKEITYMTDGHYETEEEALAAREELITYLRSTGEMPDEGSSRPVEY